MISNRPLEQTRADRASDIARQRLARADDPAVHLLQDDAFTHQPAEPYDYAVASLCFHHFSDTQILMLLQRLRGFVTRGVLINDLRRSPWASLAARLLLTGNRRAISRSADPPLSRPHAARLRMRGWRPLRLRA